MDKNQIIGIVLIGAILIAYSIFTRPTEEQIQELKRKRDSIEKLEYKKSQDVEKLAKLKQNANSLEKENLRKLNDTLLKKEFGSFASAVNGEKDFFIIENNLLKIKISNVGGKVYSVELKNYHTYKSSPLILFDGDSTIFGLDFFSENKNISTDKLHFKCNSDKKIINAEYDEKSISMRLYANENSYIEYLYSLKPNSYVLDFKMNIINMDNLIAKNITNLTLNWNIFSPHQEKGKEWENNQTTIYYKHFQDEVDYLSETSDTEEERVNTKLKWVAFKQQFFSSVLVADNYFSSGFLKHNKLENSEEHLKYFTTKLNFPYFPDEKNQNMDMKFYFLPNHLSTLENFNLGLESLIPLGWGIFGWMNEYFIIPIFNFLESFISNYGLIIFILTIFIKLILFPFTYKSYLSTAKMKVLKPEIDKINKKISKNKTMERQQATMNLYRKAGVNPMGGCLPMLLQMPILFAMFRFFPASIELRQESFLWADDLSSYDSIFSLPFEIPFYGDHVSLFTLLMAVSLVLTTKMNSGQTDNSQMPGMKNMMYLMPVMMLFFFNGYAAGLSYYYFLSNIVTFFQMLIIKRYVDEGKILKQLEANKKKPVKKSKFQKRLEEMAKQKSNTKNKKRK